VAQQHRLVASVWFTSAVPATYARSCFAALGSPTARSSRPWVSTSPPGPRSRTRRHEDPPHTQQAVDFYRDVLDVRLSDTADFPWAPSTSWAATRATLMATLDKHANHGMFRST
jgi:hypothetical protein